MQIVKTPSQLQLNISWVDTKDSTHLHPPNSYMKKDNYWFNIIVFGDDVNVGSQDSGQMIG